MEKDRSPAIALVLSTLRAAVLGALLSASVGVGLNAALTTDPPNDERVQADGFTRQVHAAMKQHHCSTTGFGANSLPPTALIRTGHGRLRVVTFVEGWEVYSGERPGTLVAVCLDDKDVVTRQA
ncbi:MAG: hypothetical protein JWN22_1316 [Nocardioides sp.]|jgi:hypothetical protein|nr:hypothetical protein [Nocardioides sp.]